MNNINDIVIKANLTKLKIEKLWKLMTDKLNNISTNKYILLLGLGNPYFYDLACRYFKKELIYIIEDNSSKFLYLGRTDIQNIKFINLKNINEDIFNNMEFDKIIMNPPYSKNLHLKILEKAIEHLTDDGTCVNLSPISEYQKCVKNKKKLPIALSYIFNINPEQMYDMFKISLWNECGIQVINKKTAKNDYRDFLYIVPNFKIYEKIKNKMNVSLMDKFEKTPVNFALRFHYGCNCDASHNFYMSMKTYKNACTKNLNNHIRFINCSTNNERVNLYKTINTIFMRFACMLDIKIRPWMGDCINPRTGLKGYESEWTDEDFYEYFGITEEEQQLIEETMEKYK